MSKPKLWFSYTLKPYDLKEEGFYNPKDFEWVDGVERNFESIQKEVLRFTENGSLSPYFNKALTNKNNSWKTDGILHWGFFTKRNLSQLQNSWQAVKSIPGLVSFSISQLEPGTIIKPHRGDTNAIIRVHLPIKVPEGMPNCSFTVNGETRAWQEGKTLLFNDAQLHHAQNLSQEKRIVLILDVIRPEFISQRYTICAQVLNGLKWQADTQKNPSIRKWPKALLKIRWTMIKLTYRIALRLNRIFVWP